MGSGPKGDIIINAHGEGIRFLKNHSHFFPQQVDIHIAVDIYSVKEHLPCNLAVFHQVIHAVERFQQRGFTAAGRTDECRDLAGLNIKVDVG